MIVDYHLHLRGPRDDLGAEPLVHTVAAIERFVETAAARRVDEIGFTEHVYYFRQTRDVWHLPYHLERCSYDLDAYVGALLEAKSQGLPVKLGLEVDFVDDRQARLAELLEPYPWDFLLGSVHEVVEAPVDQEPGIWERLSVEDVWRAYFRDLETLARSGLVDVLAHPDLAKIYGNRPAPGVVAELHREAAEAFGDAGVAVEVSTAGLRKPVGEVYPDEAFLAACRQRGVPITTASDAHTHDLVGFELERAVELARRVGYETVSVFDRRERRQEPLG
jgi:histidinol-phosphatase (PHP family)